MRPERPDIVTAAEIADYVFCPESWRLRVIGHQPGNQSQRSAGNRHHFFKALADRPAGALILLGRPLILIAVLALLWSLLR